MATISGNVVLSGVTDAEMVKIWESKAKHGARLQFNPQQFHTNNTMQGAIYNNVQFTYSDLHSLDVLTELVNELHKKEETKAVGQ